MEHLIIKGGAKNGEGFFKLLATNFNIYPEVRGDDLFVSSYDPGLTPKNALKIHGQIALSNEHAHKIASKMYAQIPDDLKKFQPKPPDRIEIPGGYGTLNELYQALSLLAV